MPHDTHIVRFKVLRVECAAMPDGQQYTIFYRRGETSRSTPCYMAQKGVIDFSSMPEGAAIIHFKTGHGGRRFAPKYIQFRVEEYTRGVPRRLIGETEVDCSEVLFGNSEAGAEVLSVNFRMYATAAKMQVAILVYPEHAAPLSFDGLVPSATPGAASGRAFPSEPSTPAGELKTMTRGEAMTMLISLETMLERRRNASQSAEAGGTAEAPSKYERKLQELEAKRRMLTGSEGLATAVATARCNDLVAAQFRALARKYRNNYIGETAAYLRQMALTSGIPLVGEESEGVNEEIVRDQLERNGRRIEELTRQVRDLEETQAALGRIQHEVNVEAEVRANGDKLATVRAQIDLLRKTRNSLMNALHKDDLKGANTSLGREVSAMEERIKQLQTEKEQLKSKVDRMTSIAAGHILTWARAKNPPIPELDSDVTSNDADVKTGAAKKTRLGIDDLFSTDELDEPGKQKKKVKSPHNGATRHKRRGSDAQGAALDEKQRKQVLTAFAGLKSSAPPETSPGNASSSSSSSTSSSGHRTPRDLFANVGLPSMGDFSNSQSQRKKDAAAAAAKKKEEEEAAAKSTAAAASHRDPLMPGGLDMNMFAPTSAGASSRKPPVAPAMSMSALAAEITRAADDNHPGFSFEAQPTVEPMGPASGVNFAASANQNTTTRVVAPQQQQGTALTHGKDDPFYDEMDDFTVPPDAAEAHAGATIEFTGDFNNLAMLTDPKATSNATPAAPARPPATVSSRPTFDFGPSESAATAGNNMFGAVPDVPAVTFETGPPTFDFGDGGATNTSASGGNNNRTTGTGSIGGLPKYDFS